MACKDTDCLCCRSYRPIRVFLRASCSWRSEGLFGQSLSVAPPIQALKGALLYCSIRQAHRGAPLTEVLLCSLAHQSLKGAPWVGSYSVVQCVRRLMGQLSVVQLPMLACGEREAMVMAPLPTHDSAVSPCFHCCLAFLHRHFPPQSPPSPPLNLSLHSQQQPSHWDCSTNPKLQLPSTAPSRRPAFLTSICMTVARTV